MRTTNALSRLLFLCLILSVPALGQAPAKGRSVEGIWSGTMTVSGGIEIRLVFNVTRAADGSLAATLDSLDQNVKGIPVKSVTQTGDTVHFDVPAIRGSYEGTLDAAGSKLTGAFTQAMAIPLVLVRVDVAPTLVRPQDPKRPYPYLEEEVTFVNPVGGHTLAGTFTFPKEGGPFPAVVLLTGSGPQDRDESLLGHKPFLVLSDYLTRRGVAVLRFDDRGTGKSTGAFSLRLTVDDLATDARAAFEFLKTRKNVDPKRLGVIGHSEGGLTGPMIAAGDPSVAFVVMMAGPGVLGAELLALQSALIEKASGQTDDIENERRQSLEAFKVIAEEKDDAAALKRLRALHEAVLATLDPAKRTEAVARQAEWEQGVTMLMTPYIRRFIAYDPRLTLSKLRCPVLAINGERDLQVPPSQNLPAIASALEAGGNASYSVVKLAGLNHLFQHVATGSPSEYGKTEETFSPSALAAIGDWMAAHGFAK